MAAKRRIDTLVPRTRSSHKFAERSDANFGFRSGPTRIELLVSLSIPKFVRACHAPQTRAAVDRCGADSRFAGISRRAFAARLAGRYRSAAAFGNPPALPISLCRGSPQG